MPIRTAVFAVTNAGIFLGYIFVALVIVPAFPVRMLQTKVGGFFFFLTCGLTHLELAVHGYMARGFTERTMLSWHMLAIHAVQVFAVWLFVWGLYQEFVKPNLPARGR